MIDPLTALSVASTAVSQLRQLASAGRDTSQALTKFAGAGADLNEAERRAKNPPWLNLLAAQWSVKQRKRLLQSARLKR